MPLTLLLKERLMRLDVQDQTGASLPVWGREDNGALAQSALESGLAAAQNVEVTDGQKGLIRSIVHAPDQHSVKNEIDDLFSGLAPTMSEGAADQLFYLRALTESLADNFLFVVEMPEDVLGRRSLVKMNYDGALTGRAIPDITGRYVATVTGTGWPGAASWHLEVHAPDGLVVEKLRYEAWDPDGLELLDSGSSKNTGPTAHVSGDSLSSEAQSEARVELAPDSKGLVNQTLTAAVFSWVVLMIMTLNAKALGEVIAEADRASALAGVTLAIPAVVVAWMARGPEHDLVSRLLILPRLTAALTALGLLVAATALVLGLNASQLEGTMFSLYLGQGWVVVWVAYIRAPVGGKS